MSWLPDCLCFKRKIPDANRTVYVGNRLPPDLENVQHVYPDNRIVSSRYTLWNFLPKNLFEQFRRIANFYFLVVGIVQLVIDTPVSPATSITPLVFVVSVTAIKQGYEDWLRHKADREVNNRDVEVIRDGRLTQIKSMDVKVGDIVKVHMNQGFPCDLVMLSSFDPEGNCYITTANLDGETNLKTHCCLAETRRFQQDDDFSKLTAVVECQEAIPDLYTFVGNFTLVRDNGDQVVKSLGPENVLLRGARLKNTPFIYGCAIYTGQSTKMALNSKAKATKFSRVERKMNTFLIIFLVILLAESAFSTAMKYWYVFRPRIGQPWYVPQIEKDTEVSGKRILEDFLAYIVLYNYVIPISLYVTIELQKFIGSMFFDWDLDMYDEASNQPAKANTSDLNEELGQVEYLFTDKTGTLTENDMQFRKCSINGVCYEEMGGMLCESSASGAQPNPVPVFNGEIEAFLTVLALCHSVRVDHPEAHALGAAAMYSPDGMGYDYQSSSPDEKAFVEACRRYGVVFHGFRNDHLELTFKGEMRRFKLIHSLEFDPVRKRMSVIVQNERDEVYLMSKGAESTMLERVVEGEKGRTLQHVNQYAVLGLRTLVIAQRRLSPEDFKLFDEQLSSARKSLQEREKLLFEAFDNVETGLSLLGATAVEDRLQEDVPQTIEALRTAGIKVWVLTGDKEETAVNISHSAGHFKRDMIELRVTQMENSVECAECICHHISNIEKPTGPQETFVLIIDGKSLSHALGEHSKILRKLCHLCCAVLCCRMSPLQKAEVVKLIKHSPNNPVTAAIGDGANDVSMIQEADVGLGVMGKEGRQAVRNSDYAIARFRFLMKVLLVHGHLYYNRIAILVQYFFYKNVAFITAQLFYTFFSAFSEQTLYESFYLMMFNMVFTALPILLYGIFEQHIKPQHLMDKPVLYKNVTRNATLSIRNFIVWNGIGLWHCVVCFFGAVFLLGEEVSLYSDGKMVGNWTLGSIVYMACIIVVSIKLGLNIHYWSLPIVIAYVLSALAYFIGTLIYNVIFWPSFFIDQKYLYYVYNTMLQSGSVWFAVVILIIIALIPDILLKAYTDFQLTQQIGGKPRMPSNSSLVHWERKLSASEIKQFLAEDPQNSELDESPKVAYSSKVSRYKDRSTSQTSV